MVELSVAGMLVMGLPALALHLFSIALTKALRSYSRSLLQERCEARGRPERADAVAHLDQRTERSAESLAVVTGLLWKVGAKTAGRSRGTVEYEVTLEPADECGLDRWLRRMDDGSVLAWP